MVGRSLSPGLADRCPGVLDHLGLVIPQSDSHALLSLWKSFCSVVRQREPNRSWRLCSHLLGGAGVMGLRSRRAPSHPSTHPVPESADSPPPRTVRTPDLAWAETSSMDGTPGPDGPRNLRGSVGVGDNLPAPAVLPYKCSAVENAPTVRTGRFRFWAHRTPPLRRSRQPRRTPRGPGPGASSTTGRLREILPSRSSLFRAAERDRLGRNLLPSWVRVARPTAAM